MPASLAELHDEASTCTRCALSESRTNVVFGVGDPEADLMFVGEAPGADEDRLGEPFVGRAGKLLTTLLAEIGLAREDVYIANILKCRPPANRDPLPAEIASCTPYLDAQVAAIGPKVIVTLGNFATRYLLKTEVGITRLRGRRFRYPGADALIPVLHPAAILRGGGSKLDDTRDDFALIRRTIDTADRQRARTPEPTSVDATFHEEQPESL